MAPQRQNACGLCFAAVALALASGCPGAAPEPPRAELRVAVSIPPLHDLVRRVAGPGVETRLVLPPGREAHTFTPSPRDVARLEGTALSIAVGLGLDGWTTRIAEHASATPPRTLLLGPALRPIGGDPHVWLDPLRMADAAGEVAAALAELDPDGAEGYRDRARELEASLRSLDAELLDRSRRWPRRPIAAAHPFLTYFADRYGLELVGSLEAEPGRGLAPRARARLLETLRERDVAALFAQAEHGTALARSVSEEAGVPLYVLKPLGASGTDRYEAILGELADTVERALR